MDIKKSMLDNTLPPDATAPRTATEIAQRTQELNTDITSVFGRLISDFQRPVVKRILDILQKYNYISPEFDLDAIDGFGFKVKINTPLAKQQTQGEVQSILNTIGAIMQFDPSGQVLSQTVKLNEVLSYWIDQMGVPNRFINSPQEIAENQQKQALAQQQAQQQAMSNEVAMENAKAQGKEDAKRES
jgi:hypothetical protein